MDLDTLFTDQINPKMRSTFLRAVPKLRKVGSNVIPLWQKVLSVKLSQAWQKFTVWLKCSIN